MRYQYRIILKLFKKNIYKLLIISFILLLILLFVNLYYKDNITQDTLNFLVGICYNFDINLLEFLWILFQYLIVIYITLLFVIYDKDNSIEFLILRNSLNKIYFYKLVILLIFILIYRIIIYGIVYLFLRKYIIFSVKSFILSITVPLLVMFIVFSIVVIFSKISDKKIKHNNSRIKHITY